MILSICLILFDMGWLIFEVTWLVQDFSGIQSDKCNRSTKGGRKSVDGAYTKEEK